MNGPLPVSLDIAAVLLHVQLVLLERIAVRSWALEDSEVDTSDSCVEVGVVVCGLGFLGWVGSFRTAGPLGSANSQTSLAFAIAWNNMTQVSQSSRLAREALRELTSSV